MSVVGNSGGSFCRLVDSIGEGLPAEISGSSLIAIGD